MTKHPPLAQLQQLAALPGTCAAAGNDRQRVETRAGRAIDPRVIPAQRPARETAPGEDPRRRAWAAIDRSEAGQAERPSFLIRLDEHGTVREFRLDRWHTSEVESEARGWITCGEVHGRVIAAPCDSLSLWQNAKPHSSEEDMRDALLEHIAKDIAAPKAGTTRAADAVTTPSPRAYAVARAVLQMEAALGLSPDLARRLER